MQLLHQALPCMDLFTVHVSCLTCHVFHEKALGGKRFVASSRDQKFQTNKEVLIGTDTLSVSGWHCRLGLVPLPGPRG